MYDLHHILFGGRAERSLDLHGKQKHFGRKVSHRYIATIHNIEIPSEGLRFSLKSSIEAAQQSFP
jgi:hypothetical protein